MIVSDFFGFRLMVTSAILRGVYVVGAILLTVAALAAFANLEELENLIEVNFGGLGVVILYVLLQVGWRMMCEGMIVFFSIHERLAAIEKQGSGRAPAAAPTLVE